MLKTFRKNWTPIVKQLTANICQKLWCKGGGEEAKQENEDCFTNSRAHSLCFTTHLCRVVDYEHSHLAHSQINLKSRYGPGNEVTYIHTWINFNLISRLFWSRRPNTTQAQITFSIVHYTGSDIHTGWSLETKLAYCMHKLWIAVHKILSGKLYII